MGNFKELRVWKESVELATEIYSITKTAPFNEDFGLKNQIQRAVVSISSNIAEGDDRDYPQDSIRFLHIAKGSTAEVITQLLIAKNIGYIENTKFEELSNCAEKIRASLKKLINARS